VTAAGPVGILGGTFDPIHHAHLRLALEAWMACGLDHVRFIPSATPPHRTAPGASAVHRLAMVELAIAGNPAFVADRRELDRAMPSYTIDTVASLRTDLGAARPLCLIVGADAFALFETWRRWRELLDQVHLIVAHRPGFAVTPDTPALAAEFARRRTDDPANAPRRARRTHPPARDHRARHRREPDPRGPRGRPFTALFASRCRRGLYRGPLPLSTRQGVIGGIPGQPAGTLPDPLRTPPSRAHPGAPTVSDARPISPR
jgi:nicotinate-nucleotide adenylyltransferase